MSGIQQFEDEWVENNTMFKLFTQSGCSCCNMAVQVDIQSFVAECTDLSDAAGQEDDNKSPWPQYIREAVWADRVRFRKVLKARQKEFHQQGPDLMGKLTTLWNGMSLAERTDLCSIPTSALHAHLKDGFGFSPVYRLVLLAVCEQVLQFEKTQYKPDAVTHAELSFEKALGDASDSDMVTVSDAFLGRDGGDKEGFVARLGELLQGSILPRTSTIALNEEESSSGKSKDKSAEEVEVEEEKSAPASRRSFRSDRRLVRLVVYIMFLDMLLERLQKSH